MYVRIIQSIGLQFEVLFLVVCSEDCLVLALLHLFVCMYQKLWKSVREIGHKPIRNGAQATLDVLEGVHDSGASAVKEKHRR